MSTQIQIQRRFPIGAELTEGMDAFFPRGLRLEILPGTGHFVHQEAPDVVNRLLLDFLRE